MTRRVLITSAIPYVAGVKHLGNLVGSDAAQADIFARFCRSRGYDTLAICATDEHGAPVELAALEEGTPVAAYAAKWQGRCKKELGDKFGLAWDNFGRSSSPQNHELTLHFARQLWKNGWLELRTTKQAYSVTDGRFLPDRYVIGTCPHCGYDRARGDQCENCTRVLDPVDLINPRSAVSGAQDIEIRDSTHLFLKQSQFADKLRAWIDSHKADWPQLVTSNCLRSGIDEGLQDRGITRDLEWGIPVPDDIADGKLKGKVFYVWFDAPIEYIASTKEWADKEQKRRCLERLVVWRQSQIRHLLGIHGQGQCAFPYAWLIPGDHHGFGRALEAGGSAERLQLVELRRRQILDLGQARHLHGHGAGTRACGLLALLSGSPTRRRVRTATSPGSTSPG